MPTEIADAELAELRKKAADADARAKEAASEKAEREKLSAAHKQEMERIAQQLNNPQVVRDLAKRHGLVKDESPSPASSDGADEDTVVSRADLKRSEQRIREEADQRAAARVNIVLDNQRKQHRAKAAAELEDYGAFEKSIDEYLDRLDPALAASPTAHEEVYDYLYGKREKERRVEARRRAAAGEEPDEVDVEDSSASSSAEPRPALAPRAAPPIVGGSAVGPRMNRPMSKAKLTDEQRRVARGFNMTDDEYAAELNADQSEVDFMGAKGRRKF